METARKWGRIEAGLLKLNRAEKMRAMRFLIDELAKDENILDALGGEYPIWSPLDSYGAANQLQQLLDEAGKNAKA